MTPGARWLDTLWPQIRPRLPAAPAHVVEVGCGSLGGFVPMLRADGYDAVGIDPQAPDDAHYQPIEFERAELPHQVDAVIASTSLHHVADPAQVSHDWPRYLRDWAERDGLHPGELLLRLLDERLERQLLTHGPFFFPDLVDTTAADEQTAIHAGQIQPTRIDYVGTRH